MKILTLNTWQEMGPWQGRWEVILDGIQHFRPDIVAFQELFNHSWAQEIQKKTGLPTLLFSPEKNGGLALYTHYAVHSWDVVRLTQSPLEEYFRYVLWAELHVNGSRLFVFNTHFSWLPEDGATRNKQVDEVLYLIQKKAPNEEGVVMGDLNATRHSPEIGRFLKEGNFHDPFHGKHPKEEGFSWDNHNPYVAGAHHKLPDRRIDFILTRGSGPLLKNPVSCDLVFTQPNAKGIWASDHFGILAEFQ